MSEPFVSVVIPVYNVEKYLSQCVDSVLSQSFSDYEIILIDDGSTDRSAMICDEYAKKYSQIKVFHLQNGGPARARKCGVEQANGEFIMFVDSDDVISADIISMLAKYTADAEIVCCDFSCFKVEKNIIPKKSEKVEYYKEKYTIVHNFFASGKLNSSLCAKLIKKSLFNDIDFFENVMVGEDINLILQLYCESNSIVVNESVLYFYRQVEGSISRGGYTDLHKNVLDRYVNTCSEFVSKFPETKTEITAYFLEHEMSVLTAMCRNDNFDWEVVDKLKTELKSHLRDLLTNKYTKFYYKASAVLILMNTKLFCIFFKSIRKLAGR